MLLDGDASPPSNEYRFPGDGDATLDRTSTCFIIDVNLQIAYLSWEKGITEWKAIYRKEGTNEEERDTENMDKRDRKITEISLPRWMRFLFLLSLIFEQIFTGWSTITWSCYKISQSV
ncbi:unnamed protein product [Lactuca virosa]|uniref:Uncharacterized protein n=1 Tax=Lactuca virosa TaxID=75947 RepID=A0AAU9LF54_9ASTR|nr:unnamed protein product [Lactuca virosa]